MKGIELELVDLSNLTSEDSYIMINVDVGKMPPQKVKAYLDKVKDTFPLCKKLDDKGIQFALIACRSDGTKALTLDVKPKNGSVDMVSKFNKSMEIIK